MTPSEYGEGRSLEHDRMQADVLEWLQANGLKTRTLRVDNKEIEITRKGPWAEVMLTHDGNIRGFVDILERWVPATDKDSLGRPVHGLWIMAYEIKPKITTVGGLIRQMRAEEAIIEKCYRTQDIYRPMACVVPVVNHNDPELPLLRRLWLGSVLLWNAEERTLA
jgi:hypothetical protein